MKAQRTAVAHGFFWFVVANGAGVLLALLLLVPDGNLLLGEWTYGRWAPLHLNLHLFGWTSLPLVGWLMRVYLVEDPPLERWGDAAVWGWSAALAAGGLAWLDGRTSGKIFLDWSGGALGMFLAALLLLWVVLAAGWWKSGQGMARAAGLAALLFVPAGIAYGASRAVYPPVNPESGGPTGASLLGSTLVVVALLLLVPRALGRGAARGKIPGWVFWAVFGGEAVAYVFLERPLVSHREPGQWIGLGLLLGWVPLMPMYYGRYEWKAAEKRWASAFLAWLGVLIVMGWVAFLPGVLDAEKFTNGLVAHSHLAMGGFTSSFLVFLAVVLTGRGEVLSRWFRTWHTAVGVYVALMAVAGVVEAFDPGFVIEGGMGRDLLYAGRLVCGLAMLGVSVSWWRGLCADEEPMVEGRIPEVA